MKEKVRIMNLKTKQKFKRKIQRKGILKQLGLSLSTERLKGNLVKREKKNRRVIKTTKQLKRRGLRQSIRLSKTRQLRIRKTRRLKRSRTSRLNKRRSKNSKSWRLMSPRESK